jgi:hypothetical protein
VYIYIYLSVFPLSFFFLLFFKAIQGVELWETTSSNPFGLDGFGIASCFYTQACLDLPVCVFLGSWG